MIISYWETGLTKICQYICRNSLYNFKNTFILKSLQLNPAEGTLKGCSYEDVVTENVLALFMRHCGIGTHTGLRGWGPVF